MDLAKIINSGEFISTRYDNLDKLVEQEFTDTRFYHSNINAKTIYCYSSAGYVRYSCDAYGIASFAYFQTAIDKRALRHHSSI